jgi:hypothetical protein
MLYLIVLLFAIGHMIRDGWPALGTTQGARALGAFVCFLGALLLFPLSVAALIGVSILLGFFTDVDHAQGQGPWNGTLTNLPYLLISGVSSVTPLAILLSAWFMNPWYMALLAIGLVKPVIWFVSWAINPAQYWSFLQPTRVAAMTFGAVIGTVLGLM